MDIKLQTAEEQGVQKPLSPPGKRMRLFLLIYALGTIVVFFMGAPLQKFKDDPQFLNLLVLIAGTLVFLPSGVMFLSEDWTALPYPLQSGLFGLSYLLIVFLPFFGSLTQTPGLFRLLFWLFIGVLVLNVAGCISNPVPIY